MSKTSFAYLSLATVAALIVEALLESASQVTMGGFVVAMATGVGGGAVAIWRAGEDKAARK